MNITLNKSSWHFKIYSTIFSDTPPKSLCPYFWSMAAIVVFSPFFLFLFIMRFLSSLFESKPKQKKPISEMSSEELELDNERLRKKLKRSEVGAKIVLGVSGLLALGLLVLSSYFWISKDGWFVFFRAIFAVIGMGVSVYGILTLISKNYSNIVKSNFVKVPSEMIKSIYTKACPIISWR
jgi:hypothetical protein